MAVETVADNKNDTLTHGQLKIILETLLFASPEPLTLAQMQSVFEFQMSTEVLRRSLDELGQEWSKRGLELVAVAEGWRFQTRPGYLCYVQRLNLEKPPRYSRAVMETLAVIAYKQPATRGDIEEIRGVSVNSQIIKTLELRGWIKSVGHRNVPGRPALYVTTPRFLSDLNLRALDELPPLAGMGDMVLPNLANAVLDLDIDRGE